MDSGQINIDPEIFGGTPVFRGTRVPVESLFDHLEDGVSLDEFLEDFPSVGREQAIEVLSNWTNSNTASRSLSLAPII